MATATKKRSTKNSYAKQTPEQKQAKVDALMAKIVEGVENISSGDEWKESLRFAAKFHNYSFNNQLLIFVQRPEATRVAGFNTWKSVGRSVKKGEKGIAILAPVIVKREEKDAVTGKLEEKKVLVGYRTVFVFDIEQTEGKDVPAMTSIVEVLDGDAPLALWNALVDIAAEKGFSVERGNCGEANGWCDFSRKLIRISNDMSELQAAKTLTHEVAHALMHDPSDEKKNAHLTRKVIEVEAESVAFIVLAALELDASDYSFGYVTGWSGGDVELVKKTAGRTTKFASTIIDRITKIAADNGEKVTA